MWHCIKCFSVCDTAEIAIKCCSEDLIYHMRPLYSILSEYGDERVRFEVNEVGTIFVTIKLNAGFTATINVQDFGKPTTIPYKKGETFDLAELFYVTPKSEG